MRKLKTYRPGLFDHLEDRTVLSQGGLAGFQVSNQVDQAFQMFQNNLGSAYYSLLGQSYYSGQTGTPASSTSVSAFTTASTQGLNQLSSQVGFLLGTLPRSGALVNSAQGLVNGPNPGSLAQSLGGLLGTLTKDLTASTPNTTGAQQLLSEANSLVSQARLAAHDEIHIYNGLPTRVGRRGLRVIDAGSLSNQIGQAYITAGAAIQKAVTALPATPAASDLSSLQLLVLQQIDSLKNQTTSILVSGGVTGRALVDIQGEIEGPNSGSLLSAALSSLTTGYYYGGGNSNTPTKAEISQALNANFTTSLLGVNSNLVVLAASSRGGSGTASRLSTADLNAQNASQLNQVFSTFLGDYSQSVYQLPTVNSSGTTTSAATPLQTQSLATLVTSTSLGLNQLSQQLYELFGTLPRSQTLQQVSINQVTGNNPGSLITEIFATLNSAAQSLKNTPSGSDAQTIAGSATNLIAQAQLALSNQFALVSLLPARAGGTSGLTLVDSTTVNSQLGSAYSALGASLLKSLKAVPASPTAADQQTFQTAVQKQVLAFGQTVNGILTQAGAPTVLSGLVQGQLTGLDSGSLLSALMGLMQSIRNSGTGGTTSLPAAIQTQLLNSVLAVSQLGVTSTVTVYDHGTRSGGR